MHISVRSTLAMLAVILQAACGDTPEAPLVTPEQVQQLRQRSEAFAGHDVQQLQGDTAAMALAAELVAAHCTSCHDGNGSRRDSAPDLSVARFNYGESADAIRTTISAGRHSVMPGFGGTLGEVELGAVVAHVRGFSMGNEPETFAATAATLFAQNCQSCHGADARGNPALGAPDLTDTHWRHGGEMMNVRITITRGIDVMCPPQAGVLDATEIELLTAWVLRQRLP